MVSLLKRNKHLDAIVVSYGGAATTFLIRSLAGTLRLNDWNSEVDGIKHINSPTHPILKRITVAKAIYVYEDPVIATLSLFRRNYHHHMIPKLNSRHTTVKQYLDHIHRGRVNITLDEFLDEQRDLFGIHEHLRNWLKSTSVPFPVFCIKYAALKANLPYLFDFLSLAPEKTVDFPEIGSRKTDLSVLDEAQQEKIRTLYSDATDIYQEMADVVVHGG